MKIKLLKSGKFRLSPMDEPVFLKVNEVIDLPEEKAIHLIKVKWAEEFKESEVKNDCSEKLKDTAEEENKAMDLGNISNKLFGKKKGRPPGAKNKKSKK